MSADKNKSRDPKTYAIIGACMEVHRVLGHGFLEAVYQEALAKELERRAIPFSREVALPIHYKDSALSCSYKADYICFGDIIAELKAISRISGTEEAQIINYLKATGHQVGLLINFGGPSLEHRRFVSSRNLRKSAQSADDSSSADEPWAENELERYIHEQLHNSEMPTGD